METDGSAYLGVVRSLCGRQWRQSAGDERLALALAQRLGLPEIIGRILAARGIGGDEAGSFLAPRLRELLPDPSLFKDMDRAAARLAGAIRDGTLIAIFGDYDVDGATSAALLQRFIEAAGGRVAVYIPDRQREGYGPNLPALLRLKADGAAVVVTVDCGTTAHEPLAAAMACGLDVIVVDHHVAEPALPKAFAIVNPNRLDETGAHGQLAAVGVAFLVAVAVNRALRAAGWYAARAEPDLLHWLDLVALGTICDVVPLTGVNRALVAQGLKVMQLRGNPGIAALADIAGITERLGTYHAGFILGPRVNAGGRVGSAGLGASLLATADAALAAGLARQLHAFNAERRDIEATVLAAAIAQVEQRNAPSPIVFATGEDWHSGVIGIVASRLKERYNRPSCVVAVKDGIGKGSGRSISGVALGDAIIAARQEGLLINGGGHAMAAGFTVEQGKIGALRDFLAARIETAIGAEIPTPLLTIDGAIAPTGATVDFLAVIQQLAPFGSGNPEPRFAIPAARILYAEPVGGAHVRCTVGDAAGAGKLKAIAFRCIDNPLGAALLERSGTLLHLAGHLRADDWNGRTGVQFCIDDAAAVVPPA
ncbi:MAG TPA: single-stranded-DNA-specific exonuclease RecJ [Stellaceae bacterium]|jgi:single-stranded-DNA-specific exonuclease|nr:single-stranded-DNA-specific exonuclease RecJ [Stellaceae bacterium]